MPYFDHNATTAMSEVALASWGEAARNAWENPSSPYRSAAGAKLRLESAREKMALLLDCPSENIVFTSGATEAAFGVFEYLSHALNPAVKILVNPTEHPCVLEVAKHFFGRRVLFPDLENGVVSVDEVSRHLENGVGAVVVMAANNETGILQPWSSIASICAQRNVPYVCDGAQWFGKKPCAGLGLASWVFAAAHKFGGPKGVGFIKTASGSNLRLFRGGEQENGHRAGTENLPDIVSMVAALSDAEENGVFPETERVLWREEFEKNIRLRLPGCVIVGDGVDRLWNTVSLIMPEGENIRWVSKLDKLGFQVSTGAACSSSKAGMSHVLGAMGFGRNESVRSLRVSAGRSTSRAEWQALEDALVRVAAEIVPSL